MQTPGRERNAGVMAGGVTAGGGQVPPDPARIRGKKSSLQKMHQASAPGPTVFLGLMTLHRARRQPLHLQRPPLPASPKLQHVFSLFASWGLEITPHIRSSSPLTGHVRTQPTWIWSASETVSTAAKLPTASKRGSFHANLTISDPK